MSTRSPWRPCSQPLPWLAKSTQAEIAVVGAGVAGLTSAYLLAKEGAHVVVLECDGVAAGMTGRSTAHIACAPDEGWRALVRLKGNADAKAIAAAYTSAMDWIAQFAEESGPDSAFQRVPGFLVGEEHQASTLREEYEAAAGVGLSVAEAVAPFVGKRAPAVRFDRQARLHPTNYLEALRRAYVDAGGEIHRSKVVRVEPGEPVTLYTDTGHKVSAAAAVLATNTCLSFSNHPPQVTNCSYVIAVRCDEKIADAITWDLNDPYHYTRLQPNGASWIIIAGGEDKPIGECPDNDQDDVERWSRIEAWLRERYPLAGDVMARWKGRIKQTPDNLAFLGRLGVHSNIYVIDGDGGLGFTHATLGGFIVRDALCGRRQAYAALFDANRYGIATHVLVDPTHLRAKNF